MIQPILTEKSFANAKDGKYTFKVSKKLNKYQIKDLVERAYDVNVTKVRTLNTKDEEKLTAKGRKKLVRGYKKAIVELKKDQKIEVFKTQSK